MNTPQTKHKNIINPTSTPKSFFGVFLLKNGGDFILLS
ncbi:hypothetical protein BN938_0072 [Mucinivorans hirudinis]|uniref:Uncharacterized protein n=1 Tax=Mucinivorans hirudinis TaxID=1433126 RepID=A0A060R9S1_9BACT|nr:hypothetical protein BN938_0072 [Mucinivorans hirudinis]